MKAIGGEIGRGKKGGKSTYREMWNGEEVVVMES